MSTPLPHPASLFDELCAEFGTTPVPKTRVKANATPKPRPASTEYSDANRISQLLSFKSPWRPTALVAHIRQQSCQCCGGTIESIGNILIRHEHRTTKARWDCAMPPTFSHALLPREVFYHPETIPTCAACFRVEISLCDLDDAPRQQELFSQGASE